LRLSLAALAMTVLVPTAHAADTAPTGIYDSVRMVFFDAGSSQLSDKASEVVDLAVQIAIDAHVENELVTGYCDSLETKNGACPALARQRAEAVKAALIAGGLTIRIDIATRTDALDLSDQRQNRRVVIEPGASP